MSTKLEKRIKLFWWAFLSVCLISVIVGYFIIQEVFLRHGWNQDAIPEFNVFFGYSVCIFLIVGGLGDEVIIRLKRRIDGRKTFELSIFEDTSSGARVSRFWWMLSIVWWGGGLVFLNFALNPDGSKDNYAAGIAAAKTGGKG